MNFKHIEKLVGKLVRVFPRPVLRMPGRPPVPWDHVLMLYQVNRQERWIELQNPATGHIMRLWGDNVKGFTRPDILELRQQLVVTGAAVELEPIPSGEADAATAGASPEEWTEFIKEQGGHKPPRQPEPPATRIIRVPRDPKSPTET